MCALHSTGTCFLKGYQMNTPSSPHSSSGKLPGVKTGISGRFMTNMEFHRWVFFVVKITKSRNEIEIGKPHLKPYPQNKHDLLSICQVSIRLDGENKAVEYNAVGLTKDAVRAVFKNPEVDNLFDRNWHKIAMSVEAKSVSLYLDCKHIQTLPIEDREDIDIQGKTVIGKRVYDSVPIDVSIYRYVL